MIQHNGSMAFLKARTVNGTQYFYACESIAENGATAQKDIYYFGKHKPSKSAWEAVMNALAGKDVYGPEGPLIGAQQAQAVDVPRHRLGFGADDDSRKVGPV